jgi:RHS repeat-associated protein
MARRRSGSKRIRRLGRITWLGSSLAVAVLLGASCGPQPSVPRAGTSETRELGQIALPGGRVELAGGNLLLQRSDLELETRLGPLAIGQIWNGADGLWRSSFDLHYADGVFVDASGARHDLSALPAGAIAGTSWTRLDATRLRTRGGLVHEFGPDGRLVRQHRSSDPYPSIEYRSDAGRLVAIEQCLAPDDCRPLFTLGYQGSLLVSIRDRAGREAQYAYRDGRLASARSGFDVANDLPGFRYEYAPGELRVTSPDGERTVYRFDPAGRLGSVQQLGEGSPSWSLRYGVGRTDVTDPLGYTTSYLYDASGHPTLATDALGDTTELAWSGERPARLELPDGRTFTFAWTNDELVSLATPDGNVVSLSYVDGVVNPSDPARAIPANVRDALGDRVQRSFDAQGRVQTERNGAGEEWVFGYDALGQLASVLEPTGRRQELDSYGDHGHAEVIRLGERENHRRFDAVGDMVLGGEPPFPGSTALGGIYLRAYDAGRRIARLFVDYQADVVVERRSDGQIRAIRRPYGADAEIVFDALGRPIERRERVGDAWDSTLFSYDLVGRPTRILRSNGMETEIAYDAAGREVRRTRRRDGVIESELRSEYLHGRLVSQTDSTRSAPTRFVYDAAGRLVEVDWPDGEKSLAGYDTRSRRIGLALVARDGGLLGVVALGYDAADRERSASFDGVPLYERSVLADRVTEMRYGNGLVRAFSYDASGVPAGATTRDASGTLLERTTIDVAGCTTDGCTIDGPGSFQRTRILTSMATQVGDRSSHEEYAGYRHVPDPANPSGTTSPLADTGVDFECWEAGCPSGANILWYYDGRMNPEHWYVGTNTYRTWTWNEEHDRLLDIRDVTQPGPLGGSTVTVIQHVYTWDAAGFATSRDGVPITWTAGGQLRSFGDASFERDASGRPIRSVVDGRVRRFLFGGDVEADDAGNPVAFLTGVARIDLASGARLYRLPDPRGNAKAWADDAGRIVAFDVYSAYRLQRREGTADDPTGFAGGLHGAGLVMLGERIYDEDAALFLSPDPVYDLVNQHFYASGDPLHLTDPSGRASVGALGFKFASGLGAAIGGAGGAALLAPAGPMAAAVGGFVGYHLGSLIAGGIYLWGYQIATGQPRPADVPPLLDPPTPTNSGGLGEPWGLNGFMGPVSPIDPPHFDCGGECGWPPGHPLPLPAAPIGGFSGSGFGSGLSFSFGFGGCGLLGIEPLLALALARIAGAARLRRG